MKRLRPLIIAALMSALSVVLTRFASVRVTIGGVEGIRIGLGALPNILGGVILGPLYGALSGGVADVVGFMLSPLGGYMPHFTLTAALTGAIPAVVYRVLQPGQRTSAGLLPLGIAVAAGTVLVSWGLTPYFLHSLFGLDLRVILLPRIVAGIIEVPVYAFIIKAVYDRTWRLVGDATGSRAR
ncbi:MAG: folate family ECF transporter S component [Bacillota bacterium]